MKLALKRKLIICGILFVIALAFYNAPFLTVTNQTFAQGNGNSSPNNNEPKSGGESKSDNIQSCGTEHLLCNPIKPTTLLEFGFMLLKFISVTLVGWALIFIVFGAFQLTISRGNPEAVTKGKSMITWSIAGVVAGLLAFSLISVVQNLFQAF